MLFGSCPLSQQLFYLSLATLLLVSLSTPSSLISRIKLSGYKRLRMLAIPSQWLDHYASFFLDAPGDDCARYKFSEQYFSARCPIAYGSDGQ